MLNREWILMLSMMIKLGALGIVTRILWLNPFRYEPTIPRVLFGSRKKHIMKAAGLVLGTYFIIVTLYVALCVLTGCEKDPNADYSPYCVANVDQITKYCTKNCAGGYVRSIGSTALYFGTMEECLK